MKVVIQRVLNASLSIDQRVCSSIGKGYLLLVSFTNGDNEEISKKMAEKISKLRIFDDENGKTNLSVFDVNGEILSVSQFTLYANLRKGNRPSFIDALIPSEADKLYKYFNECLKELNLPPKTGVFGADMKINLINDGPFTVILDSKELF